MGYSNVHIQDRPPLIPGLSTARPEETLPGLLQDHRSAG